MWQWGRCAKTASWWITAENCNKLADNGGKVAGYGGNEALVQSLCELIRSNAALNVQEMADALQVSKRTLERLMAQLKQQGVIRRVGSARSGFWQVV